MEREKLDKAAEEAFEDYLLFSETTDSKSADDFTNGFKQGVEWLMGQLLSERLSDEEKEKIKGYLTSAMFVYASGSHASLEGLRDMFIDIFGADLFKD